ncbi:MAG: OFA family MFS transporter [Clostridia bacterium]|nr:OFA family MFS transporter [Clostridia bacterium]
MEAEAQKEVVANKEPKQKKSWLNNKWMRAAIPALLIHCSIGTVYCWSTFKNEISSYVGCSTGGVEWAFSLAIFFLGMSAAFCGNLVERNIKLSSLISTIFFTVGMLGTGLFIYLKSLVGILVCYGVILGIGLGIGYLTPVKTIMLWFKEHKGLATGIAVAGFGAAKIIGSPLMQALMDAFGDKGVYMMFFILAGVYFVLMMMGHFLIKKPDDWVEPIEPKSEHPVKDFFKRFSIFKNPTFVGVWLIFYINITCGLAIISQEKQLFVSIGASATVAGLLSSLTALFNAGGRIGFATWGDYMKNRNSIYKIIFVMSIVSTLLVAVLISGVGVDAGIIIAIIVVLMACLINAGYGGGFSNLPTLLSDNFGMQKISSIHGICLSAWAFAGLSGNQMATAIRNAGCGYDVVLYVTAGLFVIALLIDLFMVKSKPRAVYGQKEETIKTKKED